MQHSLGALLLSALFQMFGWEARLGKRGWGSMFGEALVKSWFCMFTALRGDTPTLIITHKSALCEYMQPQGCRLQFTCTSLHRASRDASSHLQHQFCPIFSYAGFFTFGWSGGIVVILGQAHGRKKAKDGLREVWQCPLWLVCQHQGHWRIACCCAFADAGHLGERARS